MKCEHCGKNEVVFVYQSNINGKITEKKLCGACAEELGFTRKITERNLAMMQNFFGRGLFDDVFSPLPSLMGRSRWAMEDLFEDFFAQMPALGASPKQQSGEPEAEQALVDSAEQKQFERKRKINALRLEMRQAVDGEEFERAAQLRDQIRTLEAE